MTVFYLTLKNTETDEVRDGGIIRASSAELAREIAVACIQKSNNPGWEFANIQPRKTRR